MADFKRFGIGQTVILSNKNAYDRYSTLWNDIRSNYDNRYTTTTNWVVTAVMRDAASTRIRKSLGLMKIPQLIKVGGSQWFDAENFRLVKEGDNVSTILAIDVDRPCMVQEIQETTVDGKVVIVGVGDFTPFESSRAANVWAAEQISNSIRTTNTYRKFRIYQEKSVAQAKKPEIEYV